MQFLRKHTQCLRTKQLPNEKQQLTMKRYSRWWFLSQNVAV